MAWFRRRGRGRPRHPDVLTPAEWRVLDGVRAGLSNAEIADRLDVSVNTVRYHVSNMLAKLGLRDRRELANWEGAPAANRRDGRRRPGLGLPVALWFSRTTVLATAGLAAAVMLGASAAAGWPALLDDTTGRMPAGSREAIESGIAPNLVTVDAGSFRALVTLSGRVSGEPFFHQYEVAYGGPDALAVTATGRWVQTTHHSGAQSQVVSGGEVWVNHAGMTDGWERAHPAVAPGMARRLDETLAFPQAFRDAGASGVMLFGLDLLVIPNGGDVAEVDTFAAGVAAPEATVLYRRTASDFGDRVLAATPDAGEDRREEMRARWTGVRAEYDLVAGRDTGRVYLLTARLRGPNVEEHWRIRFFDYGATVAVDVPPPALPP